MKRRTLPLPLLLLGGLAIATLLLRTYAPPEPVYHGRALTAWLLIASHFNNTVLPDATRDAEAEAAIRQIGTNAIPFLLHWISLEPSPLRGKVESAVIELPEPLSTNPTIRGLIADKAEFRAGLAFRGFRILAEGAAPAIPRLVEMMNTTNAVIASEQATCVLGYFGPAALPPLIKTATDQHHPCRKYAISSIETIMVKSPQRSQMAPMMIALTQDKDPEVAAAAFDILVLFSGTDQAPAALKVLTNILAGPDPDFRRAAAQRIAEFPSNAPMTVPALQLALVDNDQAVRYAATNTLLDIAPEALTNVQPK